MWDGTRATLFLDEVESSCVDVQDPRHLEFEYMQHMTCALDATIDSGQSVRALHLGGAACALPWAWSLMRPHSRQVAVEVDALLAEQVREWFPLPRTPELRIRVGDGRQVLEETRPHSWDVICRDAFIHGAVPAQLATKESALSAYRALRPGGLYLVNTAHGGGNDARKDAAALSTIFPYVVAIADPKVTRSARRGNIVLVAVRESADKQIPLDSGHLDRLLRRLALPARIMHEGDMDRWQAGVKADSDASIGWNVVKPSV